jgi:membrane-anchored mycosin MYCP
MVGGAVALPAAPAAVAAAPCGPRVTDPMPDPPWPLRRLRPDLVWPLTRGRGVLVAVIDSGVSVTHSALAGQVVPGGDFVRQGSDGRCDEVGHGTIVAGIIAGKATPASGFTGIAPRARILPIRVLRDLGRSQDPNDPHRIAEAIKLAVQRGADVINLSLVTPNTRELAAAVQSARDHDVVVVAAAGNEGATQLRDQPAYPAAYPGVLAVAGVDEAGNHVQTSTPGRYVDVAAPGAEIVGPAPTGGGYGKFAEGGTSFAAAYVSGVVALARAYRPWESERQIVQRITRTAEHPAGGRNDEVGFGVVNPYWAVASIGGAGAAGGGGAVAVPPPTPDALSGVRAAAAWTALGSALVSALVLLGVAVVRRGRRRGWRPGRAAPLAGPPGPRRPGFTPQLGRPLSVSAPSLQRAAGVPVPGGRAAGGLPPGARVAGQRAGPPRTVSMPTASPTGRRQP